MNLTGTTDGHSDRTPDFTIVAPARNEALNIAPLVAEIADTLKGLHPFELIIVDDGSTDETAAAIRLAMANHPWVRAFRHEISCGQSAAQRTAIRNARAPVIVTIDADGQNDPADIPQLLDALRENGPPRGVAIAAGQRARREDHLLRRLSSTIANSVRQAMLRDGCRDTGCGLKAFDREAYLALPYFDHIHRFYPAMMKRDGHGIAFVDVGHRRRWKGDSKYGVLNRLGVGIIDLLGTSWLLRRRRLPRISEIGQ